MTRLLASVRSVAEARIALQTAIGILDLKEPDDGALGAVAPAVVQACVQMSRGVCPVSAATGDLPPDPDAVVQQIKPLMAYGVNYIKVGIFGPEYLRTCPAACRHYCEKTAFIAVMFVDRLTTFAGPVRLLAKAGFRGIMLDTADKKSGSLRSWVSIERLRDLVEQTRQLSLLCGFAGSLRHQDVAELAALQPDYLGFRTALCENSCRNGSLSLKAVQALLKLMPPPAPQVKAASS